MSGFKAIRAASDDETIVGLLSHAIGFQRQYRKLILYGIVWKSMLQWLGNM